MSQELKAQVRRFYDNYHRLRLRTPDTYWLERIWASFSGRVLEVGAGRLLWQPPQNATYTVVDLSIEALQRATATGVSGLLADGELLPFAAASFDLVACHDVLEHVVAPEQFLTEMARVSCDRILVAGPNYVGPDYYYAGLDRTLPHRAFLFLQGSGRRWHRITTAHLAFDEHWRPDADAITAVNSFWVAHFLRNHGFRIVRVETWPSQQHLLNRLPLLRHLGPFMLVIAQRRRG